MGSDPAGPPDRRQYDRAVLELPASAVRRSVPLDHPERVVKLHIVDVSRGGIGALAPRPLDEEEPVVVFFPPMGARKGLDTHGVVVRCDEGGDRYRVGIVFENPWPEQDTLRHM